VESSKKRYKRTLWRYSPEAVSEGKPSDVIFAVVRNMDPSVNRLLAWELEVRSYGIYHPMYGHIPYEYVDDFDLFVSGNAKTYPKFEFRADSPEMTLLDNQIDFSKLDIPNTNRK
jgi:hypothetical protein